MNCSSCHASLPEHARFCLACGRPVSAVSGTDATLTEHARPPERPVPPRRLPPGTRIGPYVIERALGEGGMGAVYLASDDILARLVAIKTLHVNLMGDPGIRRRFAREARVMTGWSHPGIVTTYDCIETDDVHALVMEYVDGPTLEDYLGRWGGPLPLAEVRLLFDDLLDAMDVAHARGIVHRDLKPQNVLLRPDAAGLHPKVLDFGIAKVLEGTAYTMTGAVLGTSRYMSPEQVKGPQATDHRSDIYSLGVMLYRTVTGRHPFESDSHYELMMAHVHEPVPPPSQYRPELPAAFEALIVDALAKAPSDRPEDCAAMRRRMDVALADTPAGRASVPSAPRPPVIASGSGPDMVLVPPGAFAMGPSRREVFLDAFYAARTPVTNAQFEAFVRVTGYRPSDAMADRFLAHWRGGGCPPALADHPVVFVSWLDAQAYCAWAGRRLPTEAEWEKAARGDDGRKYPWGKTDPSAERANYGRARSGHTSPVDAHPAGASPYGLLDMAGNVWEWCEDVDDPAFYLRGPERNPRRTVGDGARVARGGSFMYDARSLRTFSRASFEPTFRFAGIGFRCALSAT